MRAEPRPSLAPANGMAALGLALGCSWRETSGPQQAITVPVYPYSTCTYMRMQIVKLHLSCSAHKQRSQQKPASHERGCKCPSGP